MNELKKEKLPEKRGLTVDEIIATYPMTVRILLVQLMEQIKRLERPKVTEKWIEEKARESINKSFKDYETEIQAILFVDPIHKSSYRKINKATDALVDHIWDSIRSLVGEINRVA